LSSDVQTLPLWPRIYALNCRIFLCNEQALVDHIAHRLRMILGISTFQPTIFKGGLGDSDQGGVDETGFWIARVGRAKAPKSQKARGVKQLELDEKKFRYLAMATKEIAEGIRKSESAKLEKFIASKISS
jgi:hypothetical protein